MRHESEQPVGAPCYQWVDCRDHAGITCFPHSGSWQAQGGPAYICRDQRKCVYNNMGPLREKDVCFGCWCIGHISNDCRKWITCAKCCLQRSTIPHIPPNEKEKNFSQEERNSDVAVNSTLV